MKPRRLCSTAGTSIRVIGSIWLATYIVQGETVTGSLVLKNSDFAILLDTAFIDTNVRTIFLREYMIYLINSTTLASMRTDHKNSPITQLGDMTGHLVSFGVAIMVMIPAMSQVQILLRAQVTEQQEVDTHPHLVQL